MQLYLGYQHRSAKTSQPEGQWLIHQTFTRRLISEALAMLHSQ